MDPDTGDIYHVTFKPAPTEISERLIQRPDDTEDTVRSDWRPTMHRLLLLRIGTQSEDY